MIRAKPRSRFPNYLLAVVSALLAVGALLAAEAMLRHVETAPADPEYEKFLEQSLSYLEPCSALAELSDRSFEGTRIVVIGESSGALLGDALNRLVADGVNARIANCAQGGSSFAHLAARFDAAIEADVDAIVIVFGHNYDFEAPFTRWQIRLQQMRLRSRLMSTLGEPLLGGRPQSFERTTRELAPFEAFLRRAAAESRKRGFRLVLNTMASNYLYPPVQDANASRSLFESRLLRMTEPRAATRRLAEIVRATDDAGASFELGIWLAADGDFEASRAALERALGLDAMRFRARGAQAEMIRRVAREEGLILRDTAKLRAASDGIIGWESVVDNCHLHLDLFGEEAGAVLDLLGAPQRAADSRSRPDSGDHFGAVLKYLGNWFEGSLRSESQWLLVASIWRFVRLNEPRIGQRLDVWIEECAGKNQATAPEVRSLLLNAASRAHWLAGQTTRARELNERARAASAKTALPWMWRGLYDVADGRMDDAHAAFSRALELEPNRADARGYLELLRPRRESQAEELH